MTQASAPALPGMPRQYQKPVHPKAPFSFRRNVLPPLLGFMVFAGVLGLLNHQWVIAQAQYRFYQPNTQATAVIEATSPDKDSVKLLIPKINVDAPIVYDEPSFADWKVQTALRRGPVHFGTTALPGQAGNMVVVGHSSGVAWAPGDYKFVFTLLDKLTVGDRILLDYKGTRYIYKVSETKVVKPSDLSVVQSTTKPQLTLITCTPVGTSTNRLVVIAKQVSPKPETATPINSEDVKPVTAFTIPR
jgi:LPXTG-site transpeptidase (sortase) family protein